MKNFGKLGVYKEQPELKRPRGIIFIIIFHIVAIFTLVILYPGSLGGDHIAKFSEHFMKLGFMAFNFWGEIIVLTLAIGGIWGTKNWARKLLIYFSLFSTGTGIYAHFIPAFHSLVGSDSALYLAGTDTVFGFFFPFEASITLLQLTPIVIFNVIIIRYLRKPHVKAYFGQNDSSRMTIQ